VSIGTRKEKIPIQNEEGRRKTVEGVAPKKVCGQFHEMELRRDARKKLFVPATSGSCSPMGSD